MPNWAEAGVPNWDTVLFRSAPDKDDMTVNGVAGVTGTLPYAVGLPGHRIRWLKVESRVDADETVEAEKADTSLKVGDTVPLRSWSRWRWTILSRTGASPEWFGRTSCLRASIFEAAEKVGLNGVLVADAGSDPGPGVNVGEAVGEVGSW
jgi:hypothetical protein